MSEREVNIWFFGASVVDSGRIEPNAEGRHKLLSYNGQAVLCILPDEWPVTDQEIDAVASAFRRHLRQLRDQVVLARMRGGDGDDRTH